VAEELGIREILVPLFPGNLSALGLLASDQRLEHVRTFLRRLSVLDIGELEAVLRTHEDGGRTQLFAAGFPMEKVRFIHALDMRYARQAFEIDVPLPAGPRDAGTLRTAFLDVYGRRYGHADPHAEIEVVNVRTIVIGITPKPEIERYGEIARTLDDALVAHRTVVFRGAAADCPVYDRDRLPAHARFNGPGIVEEAGATTVIFPGWTAAADVWGNLRLSAAG